MRLFRSSHRGAPPHLATYRGCRGSGLASVFTRDQKDADKRIVSLPLEGEGEDGRKHLLIATPEEAETVILALARSVGDILALEAGRANGLDGDVFSAQATALYLRKLADAAEDSAQAANAEHKRRYGHLARNKGE